MPKIILKAKTEGSNEWSSDPFVLTGSTVWPNQKKQPVLYLHIINMHTGICSLRKASLCKVVSVDGEEVTPVTKAERLRKAETRQKEMAKI